MSIFRKAVPLAHEQNKLLCAAGEDDSVGSTTEGVLGLIHLRNLPASDQTRLDQNKSPAPSTLGQASRSLTLF